MLERLSKHDGIITTQAALFSCLLPQLGFFFVKATLDWQRFCFRGWWLLGWGAQKRPRAQSPATFKARESCCKHIKQKSIWKSQFRVFLFSFLSLAPSKLKTASLAELIKAPTIKPKWIHSSKCLQKRSICRSDRLRWKEVLINTKWVCTKFRDYPELKSIQHSADNISNPTEIWRDLLCMFNISINWLTYKVHMESFPNGA